MVYMNGVGNYLNLNTL